MNLTPRSLQQVALCYTLVINFPKKLEFIMYLQISRIRVNIYGNLKPKKKKTKKKQMWQHFLKTDSDMKILVSGYLITKTFSFLKHDSPPKLI